MWGHITVIIKHHILKHHIPELPKSVNSSLYAAARKHILVDLYVFIFILQNVFPISPQPSRGAVLLSGEFF